MTFKVVLHEDASKSLLKIDKSSCEKLIKRIYRMREEPSGRHLHHGLNFFVVESGQYRIVYTCDDFQKIIYFVGNHKEYEKWYKSRE